MEWQPALGGVGIVLVALVPFLLPTWQKRLTSIGTGLICCLVSARVLGFL